MLSFFICLKSICRKVKSGKSGKSQGILAPDMAGNLVIDFKEVVVAVKTEWKVLQADNGSS